MVRASASWQSIRREMNWPIWTPRASMRCNVPASWSLDLARLPWRDWFACSFEVEDANARRVLTVPFSDIVPEDDDED